MVMSFRVTELQTLLGFAGKNRSGRKNELQARALELVKSKSSPIVTKIRELHRSCQVMDRGYPGPPAKRRQFSFPIGQEYISFDSLRTFPPAPINMTYPPNIMSNPHYQSNNSRQSMSVGQSTNVNSAGSYNSGANGVPHNQPRVYTGYGSGNSEKVLQGIANSLMYNKPTVVSMPICPDVKMKRLPFYEIVSELIKPSSLLPHPHAGIGRLQEGNYPFCLTPQQAADIGESREYVAGTMGDQKLQYMMQVQLRFCSLESTGGAEQDDQFPPSLCVKVNGKVVPLPHPIPSNRPGVDPKRPSRPLNVTNFVKISPTITNTVVVTWASDNTRGYAMSLYLVKKMTSNDLLSKLRHRGARPADYSRGLIKELIAKDDGDCMIAMTSLKVSIACPLGKCRMSLPCRATTCKHLQCFDANLFLQMNERKPTWVCPVCDKPTLFDDLSIDGYFQEVISKLTGSDCMDVELLPDGSWKSLASKSKKDGEDSSPPAKKMKSDQPNPKPNLCDTISLDDDIVIEEDAPVLKTEPQPNTTNSNNAASTKKNPGPAECIDLTLDSSDEEDNVEIPQKRSSRLGGARPNYAVDNDENSSSSNSSSTTDGSAPTRPASPVAPMSPACITLDSRSPSPECPPSPGRSCGTTTIKSNARPKTSERGAAASISVSSNSKTTTGSYPARDCSLPSGSGIHNDNRSSSSTTYDYGHSLVQPSGYPRSNATHNQPMSPVYTGSAGYMPYDGQNYWGAGSSGNLQTPFPTLDFSQLDYNNPMDYFGNPEPRGNNVYRWP